MSKLDELFKEKLTDHAITPSSGAWQKVETRLSKKNNAVVWMRWAAVLTLGSLILGTLWLRNEEISEPLANEKPSPKPKNEIETHKSVKPTLAEEKTIGKTHRKRTLVKSAPKILEQPIRKDQEVAQMKKEEAVKAVETAQVVTRSQKPIVLTYTLDPVEAPSEKVSPETVAASDKKETSLKRVMDFAKNVKNSESPLGGLRGMKEDLFALDLKKKTTNKENNE